MNEQVTLPVSTTTDSLHAYEDLRGKTVLVDAPNTAYALQLYKMLELNGVKSVDLDDPKGDLSGVIALQLHVGPAMEVHFKDIAIKELR